MTGGARANTGDRTATVDAFEIDDIIQERRRSGELYAEFLSVPAMSAGVYELAAGADDPQSPHAEDEIYYALSGRASIRVNGEDRDLRAGSVVFVPAGAEHRFHSIAETLTLLVVFAPARGTGRKSTITNKTREMTA